MQVVLHLLIAFMLLRFVCLKLICINFSQEQAPLACDSVVTCYQLEELSLNISDNTSINFNSEKIPLHHLIRFSHISHLSLYSDEESTILCNNSTKSSTAGFQFSNVSNLLLKNLKFEGCGAIHPSTTMNSTSCVHDKITQNFPESYVHCRDTVDFKSTLYVQDCNNVTLTNVRVEDGDGTGMAMFDTVGVLIVANCTFKNNRVRLNHPRQLPGGGGVYIEFTYCPPGRLHTECTYGIRNNNTGVTYTFENNMFLDNYATTLNPKKTSFSPSVGNKFQGMGRGGGVSIIFKGNASNNSVQIVNCSFVSNRAVWGGGIYIDFQDNSSKNVVSLRSSQFCDNIAYLHGGGGVKIGYLLFGSSQLNQNKVVLSGILFYRNRAEFGGGVIIFSGQSTSGDYLNGAEFHNCSWIENSAKFGSAVDVTADSWEVKTNTFLPEPLFADCKFVRNFVLNQTSTKGLNNFFIGKGAFQSKGFLINLRGKQSFEGNDGSAMHLTSSIINFQSGSLVYFKSNSGLYGGAISLIGISAIKVNDDSEFLFINNTASSAGGAIYYFSIDNHNYLSSRSCFIHYKGSKSISERNVTLQFSNNRVWNTDEQVGQAIFASSLIPCMAECNSMEEQLRYNTTVPFSCVGNFMFNEQNIIATSGAGFSSIYPLPFRAIPGKPTKLPVAFQDDLDQTVRGKCSISVENKCSDCRSTFSYEKKFEKTFFGLPGEHVRMTIEAIGFREVLYSATIELTECPPGYVMNKLNMRCICSADSSNKFYRGIDKCNHSEFRAYIRRGFWAGYNKGANETEGSLVTGHCPFCLYKNPRKLLPMEASRHSIENDLCVTNRTGILCGECKKNYSIFFHNDKHECYLNSNFCKYGLIFYILSELVPVTVFFVLVLAFKISFTSGSVNGFILFVQLLVNMQLDADGLIHSPRSTQVFSQSIGLIYKMFNLDFFSVFKLSFCIWEGAGSLDILAMKYVTITYSLALVLFTILVLRLCGSCKTCKIISLKSNVTGGPKTKSSDSFIHGLSSFFVMCYAQCATVSVFILTPGFIYHRSDSDLAPYHVVLYNGEVGYFHSSHLPYAIPALFFLVTVVIIPPALFVVYPLCYKLFNILKIKEAKVITLCRIFPLEKLKPVFDSFQSCYKDDFRFFAGLYFFYRLVIPVTSVMSKTIMFYVYVELELIFFLFLHSLFQPYQNKWHNRLDTILLFLLTVINGMTLWKYVLSTGIIIQNYQHHTDIISSMQAALVFLPLLCFVMYFTIKLLAKLVTRILTRLKWNSGNQSDTNQSLTLSFLDRRLLDDDGS